MSGTLYIVALPIGNPADITLRALEVLRAVEVVAAEDTRHYATFDRVHGIGRRAVSLHEHNEQARVPELIDRLREGADVALVSDAGTPLLNDPGYRLVTAAIEAGVGVTSVPGPSAITTAVAAAGLPPVPFRFCGFPPRTASSRRAFYTLLVGERATLVVFEAPHRLAVSLRDAQAALGDRPACLARSMTKPHERFQRGSLAELAAAVAAEGTVRGECTLVIAGAAEAARAADERAADERATASAELLLGQGVPPRTVVALLTSVFDLPRRRAYELAHAQPARSKA
jgi:16S rRNA (cytidine1402-2'-O)-methyltransferase